MAAIGPFSIDTYLPSFPAIGAGLGATQIEVQQTLTAYLAPFAFMILWHGALADALGRRRIILGTLFVYAAASLLCAFAPSIEWLWAGRALQALGAGSGMVVGRAIIRDVLHDGPAAQRLMATVGIMFGLAPAIAPVLGGWIHDVLGWRAVFGFLAGYGALMLALCFAFLPETLPAEKRQSLHPAWLARSYFGVFTHGEFLLLATASALNFAAFFIYVLSAPVFLMQHLGLSEREFGWLFIPSVGGMMLGSYVSGKLAGRLSQRRTIAWSYTVMIAAALANLCINLWLPPGLLQAVAPIALFCFGMAAAMPSLSLLILDLLPQQRGLISSCQAFAQTAINATAAGVLAPLLWHSTLSLAQGMIGLAAGGLLLFGWYLLHHKRGQGIGLQ
jgi:MFS transporter, DHA1 family, multidrug resistance protein